MPTASSKPCLLLGLRADEFRHPVDLQATRSLQQLPGLGLLIQNLLGSTAGEMFYLDNIASSIQINEHQLPEVYQLLVQACRILDLEVPQLYVRQNPVPNAYTFAMQGKKPFIVLHSSLLDLLEPKELQAVIAHELGHLKCNHGVYLTMANLLVLSTSLLPFGGLFYRALQDQLLHWLRCAEFTCDRAALLVTQDARTVISVLMKLCGGSPQLAPGSTWMPFWNRPAPTRSWIAISGNWSSSNSKPLAVPIRCRCCEPERSSAGSAVTLISKFSSGTASPRSRNQDGSSRSAAWPASDLGRGSSGLLP
jgi:Zn-dependent protease with chaperone function